jgi:DnaJ-class molecular chaperone
MIEVSSAYETLSHPTRRRDYDINGRRYYSQNSEETLSTALAQVSIQHGNVSV